MLVSSYRVLDSEPSGRAQNVSAERRADRSSLPAPATQSTETTTTQGDATTTSSNRGGGGSPAVSAPLPVAPEASLSEEQRYAYHLAVRERRSIFITGGAGTGKSHLLRTIIQGMPLSSTFVTATTGIAALNLNGTTLHSFVGCGVPDKRANPSKVLSIVFAKSRCVRNWRLCRTLVVDEVSMLEASFFDLVDCIARCVRNRPGEPFGGIQLILSGDFLQLPPVGKGRRDSGAPFCFETHTWIRVNPRICLLSMPFRQRDLRFFKVLNEMRFGDLQPDSLALLYSIDTANRVYFVCRVAKAEAAAQTETAKTKAVAGLKRDRDTATEADGADNQLTSTFFDPTSRPPERQARLELVDGTGRPMNAPFDGYTILRPTRAEVDAQNDRYFNQLDTEVLSYVGTHTGAGAFPANHLTEVVRLRKGCRVMVIKNFDLQSKLVNGSTGTVTGFVSFAKNYRFQSTGISATDAHDICVGRGHDAEQRHTLLPIVAFDARNLPGQSSVDEIVVEPQEWVEKEGTRVKSRSVQIPLVLAYAITIHKSQGMSLTQVDIDFAKVFEAGQSYVALSRCTDLKRVRLHGFNAHLVSANSTALAYYKAVALHQQRLDWQRQHTPHVVSAIESAEARSCTPYGYVLGNEFDALRHYGEADSSHGLYRVHDNDEADEDAGRREGEEVEAEDDGDKGPRSDAVSSGERCCEKQKETKLHRRLDLQHTSTTATTTTTALTAAASIGRRESEGGATWLTETQRLDDLRRRITPFLHMADLVKRLVLREMLPLPQVRSSRLVMDVDALFHLVTGPVSATVFDVLFGKQDNMMRVPLCVQALVEEAAAYRSSSSPSVTPSLSQHCIITTTERDWEQQQPLQQESCVLAEKSADTLRPDAALLKASDVAAEALALMARARQEFILDVQRPEQTAALPEPSQDWLRFADVLPLLLLRQREHPSVSLAHVSSTEEEAIDGGSPGAHDADAEASSEMSFLLNRDPREAAQHRAIIEYALFLKASYGQDVAVCTDSILLAAYALAWGLQVVSVECLF